MTRNPTTWFLRRVMRSRNGRPGPTFCGTDEGGIDEGHPNEHKDTDSGDVPKSRDVVVKKGILVDLCQP